MEYTKQTPITKVQLSFLRMLSGQAKQKFTYLCRNSVAWYSESGKTYDFALRFLGSNNNEFSYRSLVKPEVLFDGCKVSVSQYEVPTGN